MLKKQSTLSWMKNLFLFCLVGLIATNALTITLKNGVEQCIWEVGKTGDQLYASYEVTKGDEKNIIVSVVLCGKTHFADNRQRRSQDLSIGGKVER